MLAKIVATRRSSADQLRGWLSYRLTAPMAAPSASIGMPATAWIPVVLAAIDVVRPAFAGVSRGDVRHRHWGCRCDSVDARALLPVLLHTLEGGNRFNGGGDEALLAVVNQRHARSGQVEHLSHLFGQVMENVTDAVTACEGGGEPLQAVEKCVGIGHSTSPFVGATRAHVHAIRTQPQSRRDHPRTASESAVGRKSLRLIGLHNSRPCGAVAVRAGPSGGQRASSDARAWASPDAASASADAGLVDFYSVWRRVQRPGGTAVAHHSDRGPQVSNIRMAPAAPCAGELSGQRGQMPDPLVVPFAVGGRGRP